MTTNEINLLTVFDGDIEKRFVILNKEQDQKSCSRREFNDCSANSTYADSPVFDDPLGISLELQHESFVDPLGISLELNHNSSEKDDSFISDMSIDPIGISLLDAPEPTTSTDMELGSYSETSGYSNFGKDACFLTSTPRKGTGALVIDTEQISSVVATPLIPRSPIRKAPIYLSKGLQRRALDPNCILEDITNQCNCRNSCIDKFTYDCVQNVRSEFWRKDKHQRSAWLISKLRSGMKCGKYMNVFMDNGIGVCLTAFGLLLHVNRNSISRHRKLAKEGFICPVFETRGVTHSAVTTIAWIENYASLHGDRMPHNPDIMLPYKTRLRNIYKLYKEEVECSMSESSFYRLWKNHFPTVKVKKTNSFAQCTKCASLQMMIARSSCPVERQELSREKDLHNKRQMLERTYYYAKRMTSRRNPDKYLSLIIDGMDQSKTDLPHFTGRQAKIINPAVLLKTHITGVISHGHGQFRSYLDVQEYPHDPNLTINVLSKTIMNIADKQNQLPAVLFLQADNCYRENKNRYVFGFCEYLVRLSIFDEVHISFLYSGHTHEDIDAAFSKIAQTLRTHEAETLDELLHLIPNSSRLEGMLDFKSWLYPHLCNVKGISEALHYKIKKVGQQVHVYFKGQHHTPWIQMEGLGSFLRAMPKGKPKPLKPNYSKIEDNKERLKKQIQEIPFLFGDRNNMCWWDEFLENPAKDTHSYSRHISSLPKQKETQREDVEVVISEELKRLLNKESAVPKITCEQSKNGKKRKH